MPGSSLSRSRGVMNESQRLFWKLALALYYAHDCNLHLHVLSDRWGMEIPARGGIALERAMR